MKCTNVTVTQYFVWGSLRWSKPIKPIGIDYEVKKNICISMSLSVFGTGV
jgi:hypothetical protein